MQEPVERPQLSHAAAIINRYVLDLGYRLNQKVTMPFRILRPCHGIPVALTESNSQHIFSA